MVTLLDGGMGREIQERRPQAAQGLWSASVLLDEPDLVVEIHREYIDAGALVITANNYSTIPSYLGKAGMQGRYRELTGLAATLARRAVRESGKDVAVAGSLPPLEESYRADLVPPPETAQPIYQGVVEALRDDVDLYICETMSSAVEARTAAGAALAHGQGKPVYVSWTLDETPGCGLRSGETVKQAVDALAGFAVDGYLFNCTHPEAIEAGLRELKTLTAKPIGCYPNRLNKVPEGWTLDNEITTGLRGDLPQHLYVASMLRSIEAGATLVGGCCGIGPSDIRALAEQLA
ncbi:MAG: homocysteine S-methyltransferase family protein [Gammaproteobacteria bacterium]|nr:homocysteine S-methyltransferase family protein [Gammaproteobacteria bacterium]MYF30330.1 homocysteine S-methyltransferase family protein [Gammaproteobacteria bacterium]MYK46273.1 homocysteine S-methyltransferase family protein [Gammaproteobacteria bacterium]